MPLCWRLFISNPEWRSHCHDPDSDKQQHVALKSKFPSSPGSASPLPSRLSSGQDEAGRRVCRRWAEPAALSFYHLHFALTHTRLQHDINCIYGKFSEACAHRARARRCTSPIVSSSPRCCSRQRDKTHLVHFDWRATVFLRRQSGRCHRRRRRRNLKTLLAAWNEAART